MQPTTPVPRSQRAIVTSLVIVALVCAGLLVWWRQGQTVGPEAVAAFLSRTVGGERIRFSVVKMETLSQDGAGRKIMVVASAKTIEPLYSKTDTADYMQQTLRLDPAAAAEARRLLSTPGASTQPDFQGAAPFPADPYQAVILRVTLPAGTALAFNGVVKAHRENGAWVFALVSGGFEGSGAKGEARSTFGRTSYVAGEADDETRLHALVTDFEAFAGRVAGISRNRASALAADRRKTFLEQIAPGRVFRGTAVEAGTHHETALYLEIVAISPENEVKAVLRNDNSWHTVRPFQGTWSADESFANPVLNLTSLANQATRNAGPFVEATQVWQLALRVDSRGELTEQNRFFQYRFQPVTPEQVATVHARLEAEFERAVAATEPGLLYLGSATSRTSGATEPVFLRFGQRPQGSESTEATLESPVRAWKRSLHGTIVANARRSSGAPIRLQAVPGDAIEDAPTGSVLRDPGELNLRLGVEQGSLVGGDERFTYRLAVASAADLQRLEASRSERVHRLDGVMRNGIVYDGIMREDHGYVFNTRLEFTRIDRPAGVITARFRSLNRLNVFREFLGTWDPAGDSIVLNATERGVQDTNFGFNIPFFVTRGSATLHLALTGNTLTGTIAGEPHWTLEFPADVFLSVPTESAEPNSSGESGLPALPKADGAYLLGNGGWLSLPANHGHVVAEPAPKADEDEEAAATMRELKGIAGSEVSEESSKGKDKEKKTIPYLEFDGKDSRPVAHGPGIVLLYVGPEPADKPAMELAAAQTLTDGRRRIKLKGSIPAAIRFGDQRVAAYVRQVAPRSFLLTTTSAVPLGSYVLNAGAGYELIRE